VYKRQFSGTSRYSGHIHLGPSGWIADGLEPYGVLPKLGVATERGQVAYQYSVSTRAHICTKHRPCTELLCTQYLPLDFEVVALVCRHE
jgi:hypothetical protein